MGKDKNVGQRSHKTYIWIIVGLLALLLFMFALNLAGLWITKSNIATINLQVGDNVEIVVSEKSNSTVSLDVLENALYDDLYKQNVSIKTNEIEKILFVRAKVFMLLGSGEQYNVDINASDKWLKSDIDNYYYYLGKLSPMQTLDYINEINLPSYENESDKNPIKEIYISVETLPSDLTSKNIVWKYAPDEWKEIV